MPKNIKEYISEELRADCIMINSALVSAQSRKRLYWTNIPNITQPSDKGILLKDILTSGLPYQDKSHCLTASYNSAVFWNSLERKQRSMIAEPIALKDKSQTIVSTLYKENAQSMIKRGKTGLFYAYEIDDVESTQQIGSPIRVGQFASGGQGNRIYSVQGKSVSLMANGGGRGGKVGLYKVDLPDGDYIVRKLTPLEAERCQTIPDNYTALGVNDNNKTVNISNTQRYKSIGNGWTVDVITHILSHIT
jgi:DNA (cytosine-5)-methyltransferase 3A